MNTNDLGENHGNAVQAGYVGTISFASAPEPLPVPRQLPPLVPNFTGRTEQLAVLDGQLSGGSRITAVVGTAGVGKTSLVVEWAQQIQDRFPHGTLYANLNGYGPGAPATAGGVLADFLGALGVAPERIPLRPDALTALYRTVLARRQVLILLDNASDVAQVRPLLPGGTGCMVVVTSRADLKGLVVGQGARHVRLPLFTEQEAVGLVRAVLGEERADAEPDAVLALVGACARLPLALRVAAGRVITHPDLTVAELVDELRGEPARWAALSVPADEHNAVRTVFDWSYRRLADDQALMFRRLGLHPPHSISVHSAAAMCGCALDDARRLLACLADQHLIEPSGRDRYTCHDLLWAYAADLAEQDSGSDEARRRLVEWYAHHARNAYRVLRPGMLVAHAGADLVTRGDPEIVFADAKDAWAWAGVESGNTVALLRIAARCRTPEITMMLASIATGQLHLVGRWDEALEMCGIGLAAARAAGDRQGECVMLEDLGQLHQFVARWQEAAEALHSALALARELGDIAVEAEVLGRLGWGCLELAEHREAKEYLDAALVLLADEPSARFGAFIHGCLAKAYTGVGDHEPALRHGENGVAMLKRAGIEGAQPYAFYGLAGAKQAVGEHAEAIGLCERALEVAYGHGNPRDRALLLDTMGESLRHTGERERAIACWREALAIFEERGDHRAPDLRQRLATEVSASSG
ncbi:ATP-binding protein [Lentzea sp. NPDC054927]